MQGLNKYITLFINKKYLPEFSFYIFECLIPLKKSSYISCIKTQMLENNTFHGMGHVLFQKVSEQEKVIDFDNVSRSVTGATKRPIDPGHRNK